ncbi:MAG: hypothetical protein LH485_00565 [Sphingomonas bacterium]|nr:hypothetical protein [Sphingomonas bacterium]
MRMYLLAAAATSLVACQSTDSPPEQRSAKAQATYDKLLAGKAPGRAESCLPLQRSNDMVVIDDDTILYRDGRTTYVNKPLGSCNLLGRGSYALVTRSTGSQLCRGDIAQVTDMTTGVTVGSCAFGDFVPYRPAS